MKRSLLTIVALAVVLLGTRTEAAVVPELSPSGVPGKEIDALVALYATARNRLTAAIQSPAGRTQTSREFKQARAAQQVSQIDRILAEIAGGRGKWIAQAVPAAYSDGIARGELQAREAGVRPSTLTAVHGNFGQLDRDAVQVFARDIATDLAGAEQSMGDQAKRVLQITAQQDLAESDLDKVLAGGLIAGTPAQTIRELRDALTAVNGGTVSIINKNGNPMTFDAGYYARLVAVTKTRQATVVGRHNRLRRLGLDLVSIIGALSRNFCTAYLGQVFSLSGQSSKYPPLASLPGGGPPFHPQCSKSTRPFVEDLATDEQLENAKGLDDSTQLQNVDAATAQRRYKDLQIEQQVRAAYGSSPSLGDFTTKAPTPTPKPAGPASPPPAALLAASSASPTPAPVGRIKPPANGQDLGDPHANEDTRSAERLRQNVLATADAALPHVQAAAAAKAREGELLTAYAKSSAGGTAPGSEGTQALADWKAAKADRERLEKAADDARKAAALTIQQHLAVPDGVQVLAPADGPLVRQGKELETAKKRLALLVSKEAGPAEFAVKVRSRGFRAEASPIPGDPYIGVPPQVDVATICHEYGHLIETESKAHLEAAVDFLERRTAGESPRKLSDITGQNYAASETAREDGFANPYTGKAYEASGPKAYKGLGATEITSMGLEQMARDPIAFAREDPDYFRFTVEQLRRKATPR